MQIYGNGIIDDSYSLSPSSSDQVDPSATETSGGSASQQLLGNDAISSSPLTYFGGVVSQIGQAMIGAQANGGGDADMSKAVELLEGVIGLMSGVDGGSDGGVRPLPELQTLPSE